MSTQKEELASKHFRRSWEVLTERERRVLHAVVERLHISRPVDLECSLSSILNRNDS